MRFSKFISDAASGVTGLTSASGGTAIADNKVIRGDGTNGIQGSTATLTDAGLLTVTGGIEFDGGGGPQLQRASACVSIGVNTPPIFGGDGGGVNGTFFGSTGKVQWASGNASTTGDAGIERVAAGVLTTTDGSTGKSYFQTAGFKRKTADQTVSDSTTLVNDTHLTVSLAAGRSYTFRFVLYASVRTGNQIKVGLAGTATHTNLISACKIIDPSTLLFDVMTVTVNTTPTNHLYTSNTLPTDRALIEIEGTTTVNAAGTFLLQFAEATAGVGSDAVLLRGSSLAVWDVA